jgi:PmbA protein
VLSKAGAGTRGGVRFTYTPQQLRGFAQQVLDLARRAGASACECEASEGNGLSVTVRMGEVETIEHNRDKGIGVTVYLGERPAARRGHASTSDFSTAALKQTVEAAVAIAKRTAIDDCAGPPEAAELASKPADLDLYHPWPLSTEEAIGIAKRAEHAAFALSPRVRNSDGASVSAQHGQFVLANSLGFMHGFPTSRHSLSAAVIAEAGGLMQRDDWYSSARVPSARQAAATSTASRRSSWTRWVRRCSPQASASRSSRTSARASPARPTTRRASRHARAPWWTRAC